MIARDALIQEANRLVHESNWQPWPTKSWAVDALQSIRDLLTLIENEDVSRVDGERRAAGPTGSTASGNEALPASLCACVSDDAERCIALRYPEHENMTDDGEPERCGCSCHDFQRYDE